MNKKKGKPENEETREFNYEDILNEFSSDNKNAADENPAEESIILSELLAGIESQDDDKNGKKKKQPSKEEKNPDIDIISGMNLDDLSSDDNENESAAPTKKDKFEIDLGGLDDSGDIDYASLLSELDKQDVTTSKPDKSDTVEQSPEFKDTDDIELDIISESIYDSLISGIDEEQQPEEPANKGSELTFSLDDLLDNVKEPEQAETPAKEEDLMSDITVSYDALLEDISAIQEQDKEQTAPELEDEPTPDYEADESEYAAPAEDDDLLKAYDETSTSMEEELIAGYATSDQADDSGVLKTDEVAEILEEDLLKAFEESETVEIEVLNEESQPSEETALEEPVQEEAAQTQSFVIPSMNSDDEDEDFLKLSDDTPKAKKEEDHSMLAGIADVKVAALSEVLMPGIEMDPREQSEAVTRAEVFLGQGKKKEASEIYASIAKKKGVTPFVAKRLKELV